VGKTNKGTLGWRQLPIIVLIGAAVGLGAGYAAKVTASAYAQIKGDSVKTAKAPRRPGAAFPAYPRKFNRNA
jgi:hypothetical protein